MGVSFSGWGAANVKRLAWQFAPAVGLVAVQLVFFGMPAGAWIRGVVLGLLTALLAIGMALVYRANRVINFAQADLGFVPTSFAVGLIVFSGLPYLLGFGVGLVAAVALGAIVELAFVRRFAKASRLVLTVATIGITQLLAALALLVPRMWGDESAASQRIPPPFDWKVTVGTFILSANDLIALIVAPLAMIGVALFLGSTRIGTAIRGSAERSERALMLGIPVAWLSTLVWAIAAGLSFLALFLRAGILGVPLGAALSLDALVQALAALVIGRLRHLPTVATAAVALGILEYGVAWNASTPAARHPDHGRRRARRAAAAAAPVQPGRPRRGEPDGDSPTRSVRSGPPWPASRSVRLMRWGTAALIVVGLVLIPVLLRTDQIIKATAVVAFAVIGLSLVVLTGWAGQISLGQMAFVGIGAAVSGKCTSRGTSTSRSRCSPEVLPGGCGRVRRRASRAAAPRALPRRHHPRVRARRQLVVPQSPVLRLVPPGADRATPPVRPHRHLHADPLLRVLASSCSHWSSSALRGVRHSRTGRAIVAMRENERAAQSFSVSPVPVKLTAFMMSGAVAGVGGGLFVHLSQSFDLTSYTARRASTCSSPPSSAVSGRCSAACSARCTCVAASGSSPHPSGSCCRRRSACCSCC